MSSVLTYVKKSKFLKFGLPFLTFMVVGSFGLAEFTAIKVSRAEGEREALFLKIYHPPPCLPSCLSLQVKKRDEKNRMLTAEETLQFQKKARTVDVDFHSLSA